MMNPEDDGPIYDELSLEAELYILIANAYPEHRVKYTEG